MVKMIVNKFKNLDTNVRKIMINGFKFAFAFCIFSTFILAIYNFLYMQPTLYYVGTLLFRTSIMFFVDFLIMGFGFDIIKKQMA